MGGWLAHRPTPEGLQQYTDSQWADLPLGSSRLSTALMEKRLALVPCSGIPSRPDWNQLKTLRARQRAHFLEEKGANIPKDERIAILEDSSEIQGFIDFLDGYGHKPFQDGGDEALTVGLDIGAHYSLSMLCEDSAFLGLHPRIRNAIITGSRVGALVQGTGAAARPRQRADPHIENMTNIVRGKKNEAVRQKVAKVGLEQARTECKPHRSTKAKPKTPSPKVVKKKKPKKKLSGAQRRQAAKKITADIQALRREMEQHNAILQQSREAAQQEKEAVQNELQEKGSEANEKRGDLTVERSYLQRASNQLSLRCLQLERCQENLQQQQAALENAQQHGKNSIIRLKKVVAVAKAAAAKAVAEAKSIKPPLPPTESPLPPPLPPPVSPTMTPPRCLPPQMQPTVTPPQGLPLQDALPLAMPLHSASVSSELS